MEAIVKFRANDGSEWNAAEFAETRDALIVECENALTPLRPVPDTSDFANGDGYVQQDLAAIQTVKESLYKIANRDGLLKWWIDGQKEKHGKTDAEIMTAHPSWFCRMCDGSHDPLDRAYSRLCNIDEQGREWGQMYFVLHPHEAKQVAL